ncbi:phage holin family protein [Chondrinema litorale]|uniref:phage holin family protein n=1 Tax=Chondrinema litorale TaxID=2994555 RepID=UPI0025434984|nr:phage holin family protein [Chondrinema litorale]UZR94162.1 phage holin family protein [Chondrinema litorale]
MKILFRFIISAVAIMLAAFLLENYGVSVRSFGTAIIVAIVMSLLNAFIKPILVFFTLPITILTLGLFLLVINAFIIYFASGLVGGFFVEGLWSAFLFSLVYSLCMSLFEYLLGFKS